MAIHLLRHKHFGRSSEAFNPDQLQIFDETQLDELLNPEAADDESVAAAASVSDSKDKPKRRPLPATYPRIENIIDLSDDEKASIGDDWVFIGYDCAEQLSVSPRQHYVIVTKRAKYAPVNERVMRPAGRIPGGNIMRPQREETKKPQPSRCWG